MYLTAIIPSLLSLVVYLFFARQAKTQQALGKMHTL